MSSERGVTRTESKHKAILDAATVVFLKSGYLGANMDEIAVISGVSKQTVYAHFGSKEVLFVEVVGSITDEASNTVHRSAPESDQYKNIAEFLLAYAVRQLTVVLTPRIMQLRRLVIGEVGRFPELARVLYERGPFRAMKALAEVFERLSRDGLLRVADSMVAASNFNWLIMAEPLNRAMLLGDEAIPNADELRRHAAEGVRIFLIAYGQDT
ncbi:MAG TPA: TetR/AcrR family transcriptional regulator [Spirochaetia bacterium]|nr:TetR/AcrR family transcriptional regulator [Spirochaetia bacterium]